MAEYELQQFEVSRTESRGAVRRLLTEHAEYGGINLRLDRSILRLQVSVGNHVSLLRGRDRVADSG